ncbi:Uncharacterised protein [uncultured archaeon]|nr:Uncharacterised protein [uncultured archaeon]
MLYPTKLSMLIRELLRRVFVTLMFETLVFELT